MWASAAVRKAMANRIVLNRSGPIQATTSPNPTDQSAVRRPYRLRNSSKESPAGAAEGGDIRALRPVEAGKRTGNAGEVSRCQSIAIPCIFSYDRTVRFTADGYIERRAGGFQVRPYGTVMQSAHS